MLWKNMFSGTENQESEVDSDKIPSTNNTNHNTSHNTRNRSGSDSRERGSFEKSSSEKSNSGYNFNMTIHLDDDNQVGRAAILLAATSTPEDEYRLKEQFSDINWKSVATEVGGLAGDLPQKLTRALVGASLNAGVIEKNRREMHALMHAAVEAMDGFIAQAMLEASIGAKIGIVRNSRWIAVAVMGDTAYHAVAHHERCGLGVMHI